MDKGWYSLFLLMVISLSLSGQNSEKMNVGLSTGIASGWWIYTLGTGAGIDRTDNEPKITFEVETVYKPEKIGVGLGVGYSILADNTMEEFEDTRAQRRKYFIADKHVQLWQYYMLLEYSVFSNKKYGLNPQIRFGGFGINTIHPQESNFDHKTYFELSILNELRSSQRFTVTLRPFYQAMFIGLKNELLPGEKHRIFSLGLAFGVRYAW